VSSRNANASNEEALLDAARLADCLGVTKRWVYAQVEEHGLPAYKIGKSLAFEMTAVRAWLAAHRIGEWTEPCGRSGPTDSISDNMEDCRGG